MVPTMWKNTIITPVPKSQRVSSEDEIRPISLTAGRSVENIGRFCCEMDVG